MELGSCPLYKLVNDLKPWKTCRDANAGLLFDKFANAWGPDKQTIFGFDKGDRSKSERDKGAHEKEGYWLRQLPERAHFSEKRLKEACIRQRQMTEQLGGTTLYLKNTSRFVTGMGREHPLENGFTWHHTLGVPYLPGSSLKGMLRAWLREEEGEIGTDKRGNDVYRENEDIRKWFGTQDKAGQLILLDMIPTTPPKLVVDVMTPHYGPYYQGAKGNDVPGDWHSPNPITFLAVEKYEKDKKHGSWQLGILPAAGARKLTDSDLNALHKALLDAIDIAGAGAKTAVGYGRFVLDTKSEQRLGEQQKALEIAKQRAEEAATLEAIQAAEDAKLPEDIRIIVRLARSKAWFESENSNPFLDGIEVYLQENPKPSPAVVSWLKEEVFESGKAPFSNWKGHWVEPEKQNKKGKYKLTSGRAREIILTLKKFES